MVTATAAKSGKPNMELSLTSWLSNLFKKKRKAERRFESLPVKVLNGEGKGVTRDLSASGVYILTDKHYEVGSIITMTIDLESPPGTRMRCVGTIVRVEDHGARVGVAIRMKAGESKILTVGPPEKI
jgi:hypothetical protein